MATPYCFCICYKPSSVPLARPLSFIYDCGHPQPPATYPPTLDEQPLIVGIHGLATHEAHSRVYCYPRGGLLPRLLTLTLAGGYFLLRYYTLTDIKPLTCVVLCVARTFLPHPKVAAIERKCRGKDNTKNAKHKSPALNNKKTTPEGVVFRIDIYILPQSSLWKKHILLASKWIWEHVSGSKIVVCLNAFIHCSNILSCKISLCK